ncbi:MAG TPA: hypothetical protein VN947_04135 [Polyangia bacterium]|nr:hypothetical protein [Polyangia bacterium]
MRALALVALVLGLAGCPSRGSCPVDTISSASQCIPIADLAVPDLSGVARDLALAHDLAPPQD